MFSRRESIPYSELPFFYGGAKLFLDYISGSSNSKTLYTKDYRELLKFPISSLVSRVSLSKIDRKKLLSKIGDYNLSQNFSHKSPKVEENLSALLNENTYTVCTGQQAGLFTGPLFTVYKAMTAVRICELLNQTHRSAHFVPVFWVASEDHDLSEVNRLDFLDSKGNLNRFSFPIDYQGQAVQDIVIHPTHWNNLFLELQEKWTKTEFSSSLWKLLETSKNMSFSGSFVRLLSHLFRDRGVLFVEPSLLRDLAVPLNEKILVSLKNVKKSVKEKQEEIRRLGYIPSLTMDDALPFFYIHQGKRKKIYSKTSSFFSSSSNSSQNEEVYFLMSEASSENREWTFNELKRELSEFPDRFSHNVMLRPFIQDSLFPNVATVVGPSELQYYAELKGLYEVLDSEMPCLFPRVSLTLLEKKQQRIQKKWELSLLDILNQNLESQVRITLKKLFPSSAIENLELEVKKRLEQVQSSFHASPKLWESIQPSVRKIEFELSRMRKKHEKILREEQGYSQSQIAKLQNGLTPYQQPQERVFSFYYFMNFYGDDLLNAIFRELDIMDFSHRILYYE